MKTPLDLKGSSTAESGEKCFWSWDAWGWRPTSSAIIIKDRSSAAFSSKRRIVYWSILPVARKSSQPPKVIVSIFNIKIGMRRTPICLHHFVQTKFALSSRPHESNYNLRLPIVMTHEVGDQPCQLCHASGTFHRRIHPSRELRAEI